MKQLIFDTINKSPNRKGGVNLKEIKRKTKIKNIGEVLNELTRNGRRSGLTFAPEGGSERIRAVINKMVTEEDLIRTVTAA